MTRGRSLGARSLWVAVLAAFCVLAFGGSPHSSTAGAFAGSSTAATHLSYSAKAGLHTDSELLTRGVVTPGSSLHAAGPLAGLAFSGIALALGGWLLFSNSRSRRQCSTRFLGPRPARAPPLFA